MIPAAFEYHRPPNLEEALRLLVEKGESAKLLAGGQSLIPAMRFRLAAPEVIIDLNAISHLERVELQSDGLVIGALARETALEESKVVRQTFPLLYDTAKVVADPLVRQRATVGGNLAHADPANDHPATMLAYDARILAVGPKGQRSIGIDSFFVGLFESALQPGEILTEIRLPRPPPGSGGAYIKIERKVGDYAISAAAVQLVLSGDTIQAVRIGLTNVSPVPMRAQEAEKKLLGATASEASFEVAGAAAAEECEPSPDLRGSEEYKRDLTRIVVKRALLKAVQRAKGIAS